MSTSTLRITYRIGMRVGRNLRAKVALLHPSLRRTASRVLRNSSLQPAWRCRLDGGFDYESTIGAGVLLKCRGFWGLTTREVDLALPTPCHEVLNGIARRFALAKNGVHLLG